MKLVVCDRMEREVIKMLEELGNVVYFPDIKSEDKSAELKDYIRDADVLIVRSKTKVDKEMIDASPELKVIARAGVGLDNIDVEYAKSKGIEVINTPEAPSNAVAELTIGLMLSLARNIHTADRKMRKGEWAKKELVGWELEGKTLGIIGYGRIGKLVARKANALGMKIITYTKDGNRQDEQVEFVHSIDEVFKRADVITLHVPLTEETRNMVNSEKLAMMKETACIINTARGPIIDEDALYDALKNKRIRAAAIDVYWEEPYKGKLIELENVCLTPHLGSSTKESQLRIGRLLVEKLKALLSN